MQKFQIHQFWGGESKRSYVLPEEILSGVCKSMAILNLEVSLTCALEATNLFLDILIKLRFLIKDKHQRMQ